MVFAHQGGGRDRNDPGEGVAPFINRAIEAWSANPNIKILGNPEAD